MSRNLNGCLIVALFFVIGCARSGAFKRDQDLTKGDVPPSYYDQSQPGQKTPAQRLDGILQPKKKVSVFRFWNDTPLRGSQGGAEVGEFAANELRRALHLTRKVIISDQAGSPQSTEDFLQGEKVKVAQLIREGRKMGVGVVVIGRVTKVTFRQKGEEVGILRQKESFAAADVEAKVFDTQGGREVLATGRSGQASSQAMQAVDESNLDDQSFRAELIKLAVRDAMTHLVPDVLRGVEKMAWEGRVAKVSQNRIYINAGKSSGLIPGDILKVLTPGDDVYDPASGAFLGRAKGQLKGTVEVLEFIGPDGAMAELHTGGNFSEGDVVQLY